MEELNMAKDIDEIIGKTDRPLNILIVGKTGVGKSTFINSFFGIDSVKTGAGEPVTKDILRYGKYETSIFDTPGIELDSEKRKKYLDETIDFVRNKSKKSLAQQIHLILFCLQPPRLEDAEIDYLKRLSGCFKNDNIKIPIVLVNLRPYQLSSDDQKSFNEYVRKVFNECFPDFEDRIHNVQAISYNIGNCRIEEYGMVELADYLYERLPDTHKRALVRSLRINISVKIKEANRIMAAYVASSALITSGTSIIGIDESAVLIALQIAMCTHIGHLFNFVLDSTKMKMVVISTMGATVTSGLAKSITHYIIAFLTGGTSIVAEFTAKTGIASILTTTLGKTYIELMKQYALKEIDDEQVTTELANMLLKNYKTPLDKLLDNNE